MSVKNIKNNEFAYLVVLYVATSFSSACEFYKYLSRPPQPPATNL